MRRVCKSILILPKLDCHNCTPVFMESSKHTLLLLDHLFKKKISFEYCNFMIYATAPRREGVAGGAVLRCVKAVGSSFQTQLVEPVPCRRIICISTAPRPVRKPYFSVFPGERLNIFGEDGSIYGAGLKTFGELGVSTGQQKMCLSIFAHCSIFSGLNSPLSESSRYFRAVLKTYGHAVIFYGDVFIISGNKKILYKVSETNLNLRGIFPHMDRHTAAYRVRLYVKMHISE